MQVLKSKSFGDHRIEWRLQKKYLTVLQMYKVS